MCTALAGTIGTGNIVGVATAIVSGGPGAIFWMWVMALLGMMTSFSENVLGVYYRRKNEKGEWSGGAMYYLTDGLGAKKGCKQLGKVLAVLFACFCILASFGIGNMSQINSIAGNMNAAFGVPTLVTGLCLMVVTALIVIGGLKRVAAVTEKLVPLMALFYIAGALIIVVLHAGNIPAAFAAIFKGAFNLNAAGGGALGYGISQTITGASSAVPSPTKPVSALPSWSTPLPTSRSRCIRACGACLRCLPIPSWSARSLALSS